MLPNTYDHFIREACRAFLPEGFDWRWLKAAFWQESRFKPLAVSPVGAMGVAQIMPATWEQWAPRALESTGIPNDPFNAEASILVGTRYFAWIYNEWSWPRPEIDRLCLASASYNSGLGDLLKAQDIMGGKSLYAQIVAGLDEVDPKGVDETVEYVKMILRWYSEIVTEG